MIITLIAAFNQSSFFIGICQSTATCLKCRCVEAILWASFVGISSKIKEKSVAVESLVTHRSWAFSKGPSVFFSGLFYHSSRIPQTENSPSSHSTCLWHPTLSTRFFQVAFPIRFSKNCPQYLSVWKEIFLPDVVLSASPLLISKFDPVARQRFLRTLRSPLAGISQDYGWSNLKI